MLKIVTDRCTLSPPKADDVPALIGLYFSPDVRAHLGGALSAAQANEAANRILSDKRQQHFIARLNADGAAIGLLTLGPHHDGQFVELSYMFAPDYWGKGLAFETTKAVLNYAFETLGLTEVVAETQTDNAASRRLLARLGMARWQSLTRFGAAQEIYLLRPGASVGTPGL